MPTISGYASGEPIEAVDINQYFLRGNSNPIINGDMRVGQRANFSVLTAIADGAYGLDRWVALGSGSGGVGSSGQNVNIQQMTDAPTGGLNSMRLMATTNGLKFGCVQIIENRNIAGIRSGTVTVSFKAKDSAGITDVRCAVLGWSGSTDAVTRDVVSTSGTPWLSSPPTLAASWSYLNTPANLNVTSSWGEYRVNANVTGNPFNLAVFIWVNSTTHTTADDLLITDVQLESGAIATPFERKTFQEQLADCQRYYYRIQPQQALYPRYGLGQAVSTTICDFVVAFPTTMRIAPTSIEQSGTASHFACTSAVGGVVVFTSLLTFGTSTIHNINGNATVASGLVAGNATQLISNNTTASFLAVSAEL
jgi:hypothetical protein